MHTVIETTPALPELVVFGEALTDFVPAGDDLWRSVPGGSCWNVARMAANLGVRSAWAGAVGQGIFGQKIVDESIRAGLDMRFVQVVPDAPLIALVDTLDPPHYVFVGSADLAFNAARLPEGWQGACKAAHFGCISLVRPGLGEHLREIAGQLHARGVKISFDPNCRDLMGPDYLPVFEEMARMADIIKLSSEDLAWIYPRLDVPSAIAVVRGLAPDALVLYTRGGDGLTLYAGQSVVEIPALAVKVHDTIGAGDACLGGFVASWLLRPECSFAGHARRAAATAAAACTRAGAHAPTFAEVERLESGCPGQ